MLLSDEARRRKHRFAPYLTRAATAYPEYLATKLLLAARSVSPKVRMAPCAQMEERFALWTPALLEQGCRVSTVFWRPLWSHAGAQL